MNSDGLKFLVSESLTLLMCLMTTLSKILAVNMVDMIKAEKTRRMSARPLTSAIRSTMLYTERVLISWVSASLINSLEIVGLVY